MTEAISAILSHADSFRWLFFICILWMFYRWMQGKDSEGIEWRDFVSARNADGTFHGDINKLGQSMGVLFGSISMVQLSSHAKDDFVGFAAVLGVYFAFVGGVAGYAAFLRSKQGSVTTVTEPANDAATTKTTVVESPPVAKKGKK